VKDIDKDGKKFDRVSRLYCRGDSYEMELILDINSEIYPVELNQKLHIVLTKSISLDGQPMDEEYYDSTVYGAISD
jgi:DNA-directed RNA polymerase I, II, and III subunit RPABC3